MEDNKILIREANINDAPTLEDYLIRLAKETEDKDLKPELVKSGVAKLLVDQKYGRYIVAHIPSQQADDDQQSAGHSDIVVGMLMITFEVSPKLGGLCYWIESVYVHQDYRKKGIFTSLFNEVVRQAKLDPLAKSIKLYVDHDNERAMKTYEKLGMNKLAESNFDEIDVHFSH
ncbi:gcn5-related n-acetyltransferase [Stylonychia lemnae]|uniref:Gcn5-related n-acetyltransferase n=1 Tax=Stylonychia lemnae TaxID=5949 RepID=A0A077ZX40_STYLE|nr:gcn5-related n-acetyltransferase [Stylonychia lemnae]|eukprot:CDW74486.1 gcn5-related n-acetyltransferase [Stylonychia lemnae]